MILRQHLDIFLREIRGFHHLEQILVQPTAKPDFIYVKPKVKLNAVSLGAVLHLLDLVWHIVFSIFEHVEPSEGSRGIALSEGICDNFRHVLLVIGWSAVVLLGVEVWIKHAVVVLGLDNAIHVNQVHVEGDVQELSEFFISLLLDVELAEPLGAVLELVPGVAFKGIEHVIVAGLEISVVEELVRLSC
jgi:hypothetical protein